MKEKIKPIDMGIYKNGIYYGSISIEDFYLNQY